MDDNQSQTRRRRPTQVLTYPKPGVQGETTYPAPGKKKPAQSKAASRKSNSTSVMSIQGKIKSLKLDKRMELETLTADHEKNVKKLKLKVREEQRSLAQLEEVKKTLEDIPSEFRDEGYHPELEAVKTRINAVNREIDRLEDLIENAEDEFKVNRRVLETSREVGEQKLQIEEEEANEQRFDSGDEAIIQQYDKAHPHSPSNHPEGFQNMPSGNSPPDWEGVNQSLPPIHFQNQDDIQSDFFSAAGGPMQRPSTSSQDAVNFQMIKLMSTQLEMMERDPTSKERDLPIFSGKAEDWPIFLSEYTRSTSKKPSNAEKSRTIIRLRKALKGAAKDAVVGLLDDPESLPTIMMKLKSRFGRPEFIIKSLIAKVREAKPPKVDNPTSIISFGTDVQNLVVRVKAMKEPGYLSDVSLLEELVSKLPHIYALDWVKYLRDPSKTKNLETFAAWLDDLVSLEEQLYQPVIQDEPKKEEKRDHRKHGIHAAGTEVNSTRSSQEVPLLKDLPIDERWKIVKEMRLCSVCLKKGHIGIKCTKPWICNIDGCGKRHHGLLHRKDTPREGRRGSENRSSPQQANATPAIAPSAPPLEVGNMSTAQCSGSLPIIPVWINGPKGRKKIHALLDTGASFTMLEKDVAKELGLHGREEQLDFTVYGDRRSERTNVINFQISGISRGAKQYPIQNGHTLQKLGFPGITVNAEELKKKYPHLRRMRASSLQNAVPQMLIGYDQYNLFFSKFALEPENINEPHAFKCKLGWYIQTKGNVKSICFAHFGNPDEELHASVKHFFSTESFGTKPILDSERSKDDRRALKLLDKHTVKKRDRWETCLLWKDDNVELPSSKAMATRRLHGMERKMDSDPEFAEMVEKKFTDYIEKGFLIPRSKKDVERNGNCKRKWYLPWFFSYHPTKKPRLVFDAAAKASGMSLNDFLLKGPDLLNPLPAVLTRFRSHKVALTGDIKEMFHQVTLKEEDWPSQTILYRGKDRNTEPQEFYMSVLFFGSASSPCSALYAKSRNAECFREQYPAAVEAINRDFYMDDFLGGAKTEEDAIKLRKEITEIHLAGGFQVVKWNSSSEEVYQSIPVDIRSEGNISFNAKDDIFVEKTLGMYWSPSQDEFCYKLNFHRVKTEVSSGVRIPTKREMTSLIMAVFDPLGFLAPLKVKALILIQDVWRSAIGWDDQIPVNIFNRWKEWLVLLQQVEEIKINRKLTTLEHPENLELHVFCDASEEAFASAVYITFEMGGSREVAFINGKARVAPLRGLTVPKMELQAALLGSRLARTIRNTFGEKMKFANTHFWSDSKSVLCQIRSSTLRFKTFEANRIGEILELTDVQQWRWIPTSDNVADDATRSSSIIEMNSKCRWLSGSHFLYQSEDNWPKEKVPTTEDMPLDEMGIKIISVAAHQMSSSLIPDPQHYSSYTRLLRATSYLFVVRRRLRKIGPPHITMEDSSNAKMFLICNSQRETFPAEFSALETGKPVQKSSRLYTLSPKLNEHGIIVLDGRINEAPRIASSVKNPPILSPKGFLTKLLIHHHHELNHHQGQEKVVNDLRQVAWIIDCRAAVRSCWANCMSCKLRRTQPIQPEMGQIPAARLGEDHYPFHHTGVDYFGPLSVTIGRKTYKRWGALFTCLSTRAVHLELVDSLETNDMIDAFVRFACLRGKPAHLWSDNGTNFIGAKREMREAWKGIDHDDIRRKLFIRQIEWHNIPPSSPFMGGAWESLIKIVKRILQSMLKEKSPRESTLRTLFAEIIEIMNDRPLTYASSCPDDPECLTPNSLLRMRNMEGQSVPGNYCDDDKFRRSWKHGQFLADEFWKRWIREYLPTLARREKWHQRVDPLQVGDVVLVVDDQAPRSGWKKGIITAVYPGKDKQVRVVDVKVAHVKEGDSKKSPLVSIYRRPASKICPLGIRIAINCWEGEMAAAEADQL